MRVKICGIRSVEDLKTATSAGADAIGLLVGQLHASHDFILPSTAARIAQQIPPYVTPVIVTHLVEADSICEIVLKTGIHTIQLHGNSDQKQVKKLRKSLPHNSKLILACHIVLDKIEPNPEEYLPFVDAILLDSYNKTGGQVGGTGKIHDWNKSREVVESSKIPIILAGGLNPFNVAEAIKKVNPYAVDANSSLKLANGKISAQLCADFVRNAMNAFLSLDLGL